MRQRDLIHDFVRGCTRGKASELYVDNDKLIYYATTLLQRCENGFIFNYNYYARLTTRLQTWIIYELKNTNQPITILYDNSKVKKGCFTSPLASNNLTTAYANIDFGIKDLTQFVVADNSELEFIV